jgi:hypothetical protein
LGSWTYRINDKTEAGIEAHCYISLGSLINGKLFDAAIFSLAAKIAF